jgi:hypothetical protein
VFILAQSCSQLRVLALVFFTVFLLFSLGQPCVVMSPRQVLSFCPEDLIRMCSRLFVQVEIISSANQSTNLGIADFSFFLISSTYPLPFH